MFDGFDCCGYDYSNDGDYDDPFELAPGETTFCTECLCKGMHKFKKSYSEVQKISKAIYGVLKSSKLQTKNHYPKHFHFRKYSGQIFVFAFGRIEETIICSPDCLTFSLEKVMYVFR